MMQLKLWIRRRRTLFLLLWMVGLVGIVFVSLLPGSAVPNLHVSDKLEHWSAYAILSFLALLAHERIRPALLFAGALILLGLGLEFGQLAVPGRAFEWGDFLANDVGVLCGALFGYLLRP